MDERIFAAFMAGICACQVAKWTVIAVRGVLRERKTPQGCACPFDYPDTCPARGRERITNHCPHDRIQNPCPECGWTDPGKETPLQFLGVTRPPGEAERNG